MQPRFPMLGAGPLSCAWCQLVVGAVQTPIFQRRSQLVQTSDLPPPEVASPEAGTKPWPHMAMAGMP